MVKRGQLSHAVLNVANNKLGYKITQKELRLMPYVCHILVNKQKIDGGKVNNEEMSYISNWLDKGWLYYNNLGYLQATKEFFLILQELIYMAYVDYRKYKHIADCTFEEGAR